jgi:hypothetical protein
MQIKRTKIISLKVVLQNTALHLAIASILLAGIGLYGCKEDDPPKDDDSGLLISGVSIPSSLEVAKDGEITLTGKGFKEGDQIHFTSFEDENQIHITEVLSVTSQTATFNLPSGISSGRYKIMVARGNDSLILGSLLLNIIAENQIPDKPGMTVKGVVYCNGEGVPGVVVSDGYEVTTTDENGIYYLSSEKKNGYVFISVPGNYEVPTTENLPMFFKRLAGGNTVEQKDFSLIETDNTNHVVLAMADWHLANRNNDIDQFTNGFLADINTTIQEFQSKGTKVYGLTLGDLSWDIFWYSNSFALPEYLVQMHKIDCTVFNLMGNHDNDPYYEGDWLAAETYKSVVGPTYYSFNLGNIHYVVLDNIDYVNTGGATGVVGARNYNEYIVSSQMEWLKKDLAAIQDKNTPIVIGMHAPLFSRPAVDDSGEYEIKYAMGNGSALADAVSGFTNVHVLSGHSHINYAVNPSSSLMEHNTGAVCATWWWTGKNGYAENHICKDGSPGGYGVWEMNGTDIEWYYKSIGYEKNYQFRAYDLNTVYITAAEHAPNSTNEALADYAANYDSQSSSNEVLINVFGYDDEWTVEVKENGNNLAVKRVNAKDPLHIISYEAKRLNAGATPTSAFVTNTTSHLFKAKASGANSTLEITVTDRFGNVYSEDMTRPKPFTYSMK